MRSKSFINYENEWINNKKYWLTNELIDPPLFPILIIDNFNDYIDYQKIDNFNMIFNPDNIGYRWGPYEYFIDSRGFYYNVSYLDMKHPIGFVYPSEIVKKLSLYDIKNLLKLIRDEILYNKIEKTSSINEIFDIL